MKRVEDNLGSLGNVKVLFCALRIVSSVIMVSYLLISFLFTVSCSTQLSNGASEYMQSSISQSTSYRGGNIFIFRKFCTTMQRHKESSDERPAWITLCRSIA